MFFVVIRDKEYENKGSSVEGSCDKKKIYQSILRCWSPPLMSCVPTNLSHSCPTHWETQRGHSRELTAQTSTAVALMLIWKTFRLPSEVERRVACFNLIVFVGQDKESALALCTCEAKMVQSSWCNEK